MNSHRHHPPRGTRGIPPGPLSPLHDLVCAMLDRRVRGLRVETLGHGLVLRGRTDSYHAKQLAQHSALAVTGLPLVANLIEVDWSPRGAPRRDGAGYGLPALESPDRLVLLATGDDRLRAAGRAHIAEHGFAVATAAGGVACVALLGDLAPDVDVVVLDADLLWGGADGVLDQLARDGRDLPVVLLASPAAGPGYRASAAAPVAAVLDKPVVMATLLSAVQSAASAALGRS